MSSFRGIQNIYQHHFPVMYNVKHAVVFANDKFMDRRYIIVLFSGKRKLFQNL